MDPTRCKEFVKIGNWPHDVQCSRKPWRDGWCKQHHPAQATERKAKREAKVLALLAPNLATVAPNRQG
jgi:hypothetical protein